jgi:coproporphyrinogen III oxidase-like Fe-S oxidoreductase
MLRLRTREGLDLHQVWRRFGVDLFDLNRALIERGLEDGLLVREGSWIRPTLEGLAVADGLASSFRLSPDRWQAARL